MDDLRERPKNKMSASSVIGTLLLLALGVASPAAADAVIFVTTTEQKISSNDPEDKGYKPGCSLQEAIFSANLDDNRAVARYTTNTEVPQPVWVTTHCVKGNGNDIIVLPLRATFLLTTPFDDADNPLGPTATPLIQSQVTIRANGSTLQRVAPESGNAEFFRLFSVGGFGHLTLTRAYVRGFVVKGGDGGAGGGGGGMGAGGAIYVFGGGLVVETTTFEGNGAIGGDGGAKISAGGGGGGGGLGGNGGSGAPTGCRDGDTSVNGGGGGGSRSNGTDGESCFAGGGGGGTLFRGVFARGGFRCGGSGGFQGVTVPSSGEDGANAVCAGGGGGGGQEGLVSSGNGGLGFYGGGGGGGSAGGGHGGSAVFGGGGGAGWEGLIQSGDGGDGGFGGGGASGSGGLAVSGRGGLFGGNANIHHGGGGAGLGGAIFNDSGIVVIRNSTFTNNFVARGNSGASNGQDAGGAILSVDGHLLVQYATIARNQSTGDRGGIVVTRFRTAKPPVTFAVENTLIYDNGAMDVGGTVINAARQCAVIGVLSNSAAGDSITGKGNLIQGNDNCLGVVSEANPHLGPLQDNGGMTPTMAIPASSPAVDAGAATVVTEVGLPILLDQRRQKRPDNLGFDIGAVEACTSIDRPCDVAEEFSSEELLTLTVQVSPTGGGNTSPSAGSHSYGPQSIVPLLATPATGYAFDRWSGDAVTAASIASTTIVMDANRAVTANFRLLPDFSFGAVTPLTVVVGGNRTGSVTVSANAAFSQTVSLVASGLPAGFSAAFNPAALAVQASASNTSALTVTLNPTVLPGAYSFNVLGTAGSLSHSTLVNVTVLASPDGVAQIVVKLTGLGCIDIGGISNALAAKLRQAQLALNAGDTQTALNILSAVLSQLQAQAGKHIISCADGAGGTIDGPQVLIDQVKALMASLGANLKANPITGSLVPEIEGVTVTVATGSKTIAASATTDVAGFYYFPKTSAFKRGTEYTIVVTPPKGYKNSTPATFKFIWRGEQIASGPFLLK